MHKQLIVEQYNKCNSQGVDQEHTGGRETELGMSVWGQN